MKPTTFFSALLIISFLFISNIFSQSGGLQTNQITIRNDRVFMLNGQPFFPIMVNHELGENVFNAELKKPVTNNLWGFNIINLHLQTHAAFVPCYGEKVRNVISGDLTSGSQYYQLLNPMG